MCTCMYIGVCTHPHVCMCACVCAHVSAYTCVCMYVYARVHTCVCGMSPRSGAEKSMGCLEEQQTDSDQLDPNSCPPPGWPWARSLTCKSQSPHSPKTQSSCAAIATGPHGGHTQEDGARVRRGADTPAAAQPPPTASWPAELALFRPQSARHMCPSPHHPQRPSPGSGSPGRSLLCFPPLVEGPPPAVAASS